MKRQKQILSHRFDCGKESISGDFISQYLVAICLQSQFFFFYD
jgi:hypothetical protein